MISMWRVSSLLFFLAAAGTILELGNSHGCNPIEKDALLKIKDELEDPSGRLASWRGGGGDGEECCSWYGVVCDGLTGHVTELRLRTLSSNEYYSSGEFGYFFYEVYYEKSAFGGNLSSSLVNLTHLEYLDLSNNDFRGIEIPRFIGWMESLRYLNLSGSVFGGMIPHQLGNLSNLQCLDVAWNDLRVDSLHWLSSLRLLKFLRLDGLILNDAHDWLDVMNALPALVELRLLGCWVDPIPVIPTVNFSSLTTLDLSGNGLHEIPGWISRLAYLNSLDLSQNQFVGSGPIPLLNMTTVKELSLSRNYGLNSSIFNWLHEFTQLERLDLSGNILGGRIPSSIGNLSSLISLDLSGNNLEGGIPTAIGNLTSLETLDLSSNSLEGVIPSAIGDLSSLTRLDLSHNTRVIGIPTRFKNLCSLRSLILSNNVLRQDINEILEILSGCVSNTLATLILSSTQLSGHLPYRLGKFKNLGYLDVSGNMISGPIPESLGALNSLVSLDLGGNKMNGTLPGGFGMLSNLREVDISDNSFEGEVSEIHFSDLINLRTFKASGNRLDLRVSPDWDPAFQLISSIYLKSWRVGPRFPAWIQSLKYLAYLDLSHSDMSSTLPSWFLDFSSRLYQFNLSHNQMHGNVPYLSIDDSDYSLIDLSSNRFEGPMPYISSNPFGLDLSNNKFSGSISTFLCHKSRTIEVLNLGENLFSGEIPECWGNWETHTKVIRLSSNSFSGNIPRSLGTLSSLVILDLHDNNISGEVPVSLRNCTQLKVLDLSINRLSGVIPTWVGTHLQQATIIILRGNIFNGTIPKELCNLASLQILDLADNALLGTLPKCVNKLTSMISRPYGSGDEGSLRWPYGPTLTYYASSSIMRGGKIVEYSKILNLVRSLDLSNNKLYGQVPEEITALGGLQFLNISHNSLSGRIPKSIGDMKELQTLDLSHNQLSGEIPPSMSSLTFLNDLNLSDNNLSGVIPRSTQLQSFDPSRFSGNSLCGPPLAVHCIARGASPATEDGTAEDDGAVDWSFFFVGIAPGFIVGFWAVIGPLVLSKRWRRFYFNLFSWDFRDILCYCHH
ncbi:hypothetical protein DM860_007900 [Cuscuta australis]|uniref:Leucine-rich repeat-containing N-terminal plant-type domain-containing protein n=1 Tax=Cuscuta australis TaxID=267555 RepID=A0A328DYC2_9ASTE|nr:hypothetical protein DM860_007900 [Cuscuta australis]